MAIIRVRILSSCRFRCAHALDSAVLPPAKSHLPSQAGGLSRSGRSRNRSPLSPILWWRCRRGAGRHAGFSAGRIRCRVVVAGAAKHDQRNHGTHGDDTAHPGRAAIGVFLHIGVALGGGKPSFKPSLGRSLSSMARNSFDEENAARQGGFRASRVALATPPSSFPSVSVPIGRRMFDCRWNVPSQHLVDAETCDGDF